ncbi:DUF5672 family protein [Runella slithyformis]|uniref:DUF5672 domain-containing protein n=1 Tax=Runella slithyformis (strain ATCC 29530 / DSM 19594 / LMG 11500 / NCIMB 11436 / LSU 4) TaxID=761193 RepID=A0A7U3ZHL4_RUNSL|nr:DUF5672 family protein [Runella slithyformis]AEI47382.1 hypothetical protein Runsl_0947 [Runella slithyformis DSM 19594]
MKPVAVVIPLYKSVFSVHEQISFTQGLQVLKEHPIVIIKPFSLDISDIQNTHPQLKAENFADDYFKSVHTYNRLMLSTEFYERFSEFDYMLIYQLDAFVFRDELLEWCRKGYDYIGAPWRIEREFVSVTDRIVFGLKKQLAIWLNLRNKQRNDQPLDVTIKFTVGNGGFSLRKVKKMLNIVRNNRPKIEEYLAKKGSFYNEDIFFCIEMNRYIRQVSLPHWREALHFSVEDLPSKAFVLNGHQLPFGCHAWDIHELDFWKPHFETFGHKL